MGWVIMREKLRANRDIWRRVFCTWRCRAPLVLPHIGVEGHKAGDSRGFSSSELA